MSIFEDQNAYKDNFYYKTFKPAKGDFTPFYIVVTICTIIGVSIFILNIVLGCCSRYSKYWNDRHTGNRFIASLWTATPHQQPPLDLTELEVIVGPPVQQRQLVEQQHEVLYAPPEPPNVGFVELKKRESEI